MFREGCDADGFCIKSEYHTDLTSLLHASASAHAAVNTKQMMNFILEKCS